MTSTALTKLGVALLSLWLTGRTNAQHTMTHIEVPFGGPITVDHVSAPGEWEDARAVEIKVAPNWTVQVLLKHDDTNLYVAFQNLRNGTTLVYPEILIDSQNLKGESWVSGEWWLHASYNLCESEGAHDVYKLNGIFQCSHKKAGWSADNPPPPGGSVRFQIAFSKLGVSPHPGTRFGIAFDVTNATGDSRQKWSFWPLHANLDVPRTWAVAVVGGPATSSFLGSRDSGVPSYCHARSSMNDAEFFQLMQTIADAWNGGDAGRAASCFAENAIYSAPPSHGLLGREALYEYFGGKQGRPIAMHMTWHHLVFDASQQIGFGEYTFRYRILTHGIVIVRIVNGLVANWREYEIETKREWSDFVGANTF